MELSVRSSLTALFSEDRPNAVQRNGSPAQWKGKAAEHLEFKRCWTDVMCDCQRQVFYEDGRVMFCILWATWTALDPGNLKTTETTNQGEIPGHPKKIQQDRGQAGRQSKARKMEHSEPASLGGSYPTCTGGKKRALEGLQHQQVLEECSVPSGLLASSSSSTTFSSSAAYMRSPSSSFLWACRTSSVRRVKDCEDQGRQ